MLHDWKVVSRNIKQTYFSVIWRIWGEKQGKNSLPGYEPVRQLQAKMNGSICCFVFKWVTNPRGKKAKFKIVTIKLSCLFCNINVSEMQPRGLEGLFQLEGLCPPLLISTRLCAPSQTFLWAARECHGVRTTGKREEDKKPCLSFQL